MVQKIAISFIIILSASLLILLRYDLPKQAVISLVKSNTSNYNTNQTFRRGELIETKSDEMLLLRIDENLIGLDQNTTIELVDLTASTPILKFTKGRIYLEANNDTPLIISTNYTENLIHKSKATIINYDFLEKIHLVPLSGSIQTTIKESNDYLLIPVPLEIKSNKARPGLQAGETQKFEYTSITFNRNSAKMFYDWIDDQLDANE